MNLIQKINLFFRSLGYNIYIIFILILYGLIGFPLILLKSKKIFWFSARWADAMLFGAKFFCGIDYVIESKENMPKEPSIICSKHQSAYECLVFLSLFEGICFILKKELLKIPIFGSYLKALNMIAIDRNNGKEAIKIINSESEKRIKNDKRYVLIFPEGTRVCFDEKTNCKNGISFLHKTGISDLFPVWVDSGKFWGKNSFFKFKGTVRIKFLEKINKSEDSKQIPQILNKVFDNEQGIN